MKTKRVINYMTIIVCCFFAACSQDPSTTVNHIGEVSGVVNFDSDLPDIQDFEVRAYSYVSGQWHNSKPVNTRKVSSDGSFSMKIPKGDYIFTLFHTRQNGPEFYYQFQNQFPCKTYELQLQDHVSRAVYANKYFYCEPEALSVPENGTLPDINFDIQNTSVIMGHISHSNGEPFTLVTINAYACKEQQDGSLFDTLGRYETSLSAKTRPDTKGNYTICCLPEGDYIVKAEADQSEYIALYYKNVYFRDQSTVLTLSAGNYRGINFTISKGSTIAGKIQSEDSPNEPVSNIMVSAISTSTNYVTGNTVPSDANGNYTIYGLPNMHYILYANADNTKYLSCYYNSKYSSGTADAFEIANTTTLIKNFDLQKKGQLVASIVEKQTGTYIKNYQIDVKLYRSSDLSYVMTVKSKNGMIMADLEEGTYKAEVITDGTPYASIFYSNENSLEKADDIPIYNGKINDTVKIKLQRGGSIRGRVIGQDCDNLSQDEYLHKFTVIAYPKSNPLRTYHAVTNIYGEYEINGLPEGDDYIVRVQADNSSYISEYFKQSYFQDDATLIEVEYDEVFSNVHFDLECGRQIYGNITDDNDNEPIPDVKITATNLDSNTIYSATTDKNGSYLITGIPSGYEYSISSAYEYALHADASDTSYVSESSINTIQFQQTQNEIEINFSLKKSPRIYGILTCPSRHQFDYSLENITPGIYDLILYDEQHEEISRFDDFELEPNHEMEKNFDL
jgi:hypothetical protein